jgi:hypothetical protein
MKTHSADNYHVCQYPECGRRFTQESKLRAHIRAQHEKVKDFLIPVVNFTCERIFVWLISYASWPAESRCIDSESQTT